MSFGYENLRIRAHSELPDSGDIENGEFHVLIPTETNEGGTHEVMELETILTNDNQKNEAESTDAESTDVEIYSKSDDKKSLIKSPDTDTETQGIDANGVVREYEVALEYLGFGLFHIILVVCNGLALTSDAVEVLSISFVLDVIKQSEELNLENWQTALLSSVIFIGMLFGSYFWGGMADMIGRKRTLVFSLGVSGLFGLVSAFSPHYVVFLILRFFSGFGVGGSLPVLFPYISEFIRNKYRGSYLGLQSTFWMFGRLLCGAIAWAIIPRTNIDFSLGLFRFHSWRLFIAVSALPSVLGVFLYWFLPESPRYLLEVGKEKEAIKVLKAVHRINHWRDKDAVYPVKSIQLGSAVVGEGKGGSKLEKFKTVFRRTAEMFNRKLLFRTLLLLTILFCLSFGAYGVTLWYPTYVNQLNIQKDNEIFHTFCSKEVSNLSSSAIPDYCDCNEAYINNSVIADAQLENWIINNARFSSVTFERVSFVNSSFVNTTFESGSFVDCNFSSSAFTELTFNAFNFTNVKFSNSRLCNVLATNSSSTGVVVNNSWISNLGPNRTNSSSNTDFIQFLVSTNTSQCDEEEWTFQCPKKEDDFRVYRDTFFVSAAALPGNLASMVAVYFLVRKYWLAFSLVVSTVSVFLLYLVHDEAVVVVMLCLFAALSTPAWNDSSLIIAEVYPTHLRTTAAGIHLVAGRIGAIFGTNVFGEFVYVNPSIPIIIVVVVLLIGAVAALPLPKTTRKTQLK